MPKSTRKILGFSGSLRQDSFNTRLLAHFGANLPTHVDFEVAQIGAIPHFDADVLQADGFPEPVAQLITAVRNADAVVFATPEYNFSIPGVLKNAIDWVSRDKGAPFKGKPVAMMSASTGILGGVRAQYHLRQVMVFLDAHPINKPEIFLGSAAQKFDDTGRLTDPIAIELVAGLTTALLDWQRQLAPREGAGATA